MVFRGGGYGYSPDIDIVLIASSYRRHEQEKRRVYEQRVREIEHATFAPFVMSTELDPVPPSS